jgi:predicted  nucleic acid-binding Zn-ribbon protein
MPPMKSLLLPIAVAGLANAANAANADVPDGDIARCAGIVADAQRLACYDAIAERISTAAGIVAERRAAAEEAARAAAAEAEAAARRAAEEAAAKKVEQFGAETTAQRDRLSEDKLSELGAKVSEVLTDRYGMYVLLLDNGQLWKQLDGKLLTVRVGDDVVLERGSLGGYNLKIPRQKRQVRAKRLK